MKSINQSPLPFQGQKRRFVRKFKESLNSIQMVEELTFVDLFGGSGLLSHIAKQSFPKSRVIWNDYDNFIQRLEHITTTNALLKDIRDLTKACVDDKRIDEAIKQNILERIKQETGYVDYVTLSASLLFSGQYATTFEELSAFSMYNCVKKYDYETNGYLDGVERVRCDYTELFDLYKGNKSVVFLVDPPYPKTDSTAYSSGSGWAINDHLDVLKVLEGSKFYYFTSNKSQVVELCQWMSSNTSYNNPFKDCSISTTTNNVNYSSSYTDIMLYNTDY